MTHFLTVHLTNAKIYSNTTLFDFTALYELEYISRDHTTFNRLNIVSEWDNNNFKRRHFRNLMSHSRRYCDASMSPRESRELRGLKVNASPRVIEVLMLLKRSIFVSYMTLWFENIFRDISEIFQADFARTNFLHVSGSICLETTCDFRNTCIEANLNRFSIQFFNRFSCILRLILSYKNCISFV